MSGERILVIGANGQIGSELTEKLAEAYGRGSIITTDIAPSSGVDDLPYAQLDVLDPFALAKIVTERGDPRRAWHLNMHRRPGSFPQVHC